MGVNKAVYDRIGKVFRGRAPLGIDCSLACKLNLTNRLSACLAYSAIIGVLENLGSKASCGVPAQPDAGICRAP